MSETGQVTFSKSIGDRAHLPNAGKYGAGLDYQADVTLDRFEWNTVDNKPAYARGEEDKRHWAFFRIKVIHEGKTVFVSHHEQIDEGSGSDVFPLLMGIGVQLNEIGDEVTFDPSSVAPRKLGGIEVSSPRADKTKRNLDGTPVQYTGNLTGVKMIGA